MKLFNKTEFITITISVAALIASLFSIYFQFFYERNSIVLSVLRVFEPSDNKQSIDVLYAVRNTGNKAQYLLNNQLSCKSKPDESTNGVWDLSYTAETLKPVIVEPDESVILKQTFKNFSEKVNTYQYWDNATKCGFIFSVTLLGPDGLGRSYKINAGDFHFTETVFFKRIKDESVSRAIHLE